MANLERKYIIPIRRELKKVPFYLRTRKAVKTVRAFLQKHMKCEDVKLGKYLNELLWSRGNRNPPHKVEVLAVKVTEKDNVYVKAELVNAPKEDAVETKKKGGLTERLKERVGIKEDKAAEEKTKERKEEFEALKKEEQEVMTHAEAPHPKKKVHMKTQEQIELERKRSVIDRDKKDTQHKKPKSE